MDEEWTLSAGDMRAVVSPHGASLRQLWLERPGQPRRDLTWGYSGTANKKGGQGDVLIPFPGRIAGGTYTFEGKRHALAINDKDGPNAIHGFVRAKTWDGQRAGSSALFKTDIHADDHPGYPFDLEVAVGYELTKTGIACAYAVRNKGSGKAPVGVGFHPYVARAPVDDAKVRVPASQVVEFRRLLPTGRVVGIPADMDLRRARRLGGISLNHCLTGLEAESDGFVRVCVDDVEVWMDRSFGHLVVYTGDALGVDARRALAVEPMTCATDAFNHPQWGLKVLAPGEAMTGTWGIGLRPLGAS